MTKLELIDILENNEFDLYWNEKEGKEFRKYVVDLLYENESLLVKNDFLEEQQGWIPCSEKLPKEDYVNVLISTSFLKEPIIAVHDTRLEIWITDDENIADSDVIAWMPLPASYKGSEE